MDVVPPACCDQLLYRHAHTLVLHSKLLVEFLVTLLVGYDSIKNVAFLDFLVRVVAFGNPVKYSLFLLDSQFCQSKNFPTYVPLAAVIKFHLAKTTFSSFKPIQKHRFLSLRRSERNQLIGQNV